MSTLRGEPPDFFLEYDTGTITLSTVTDKLHGYTALEKSTGITTPILFWFHSPQRETNFHERIGTPRMPIATAVRTTATDPSGPAGPLWQPAGIPGPRRTLADLKNAWLNRARTPQPGPGSNRDSSTDPDLDW